MMWGNMASRDPSISYDGETIVYSTKSSNLLDENITRADGEVCHVPPDSYNSGNLAWRNWRNRGAESGLGV